MNILLLPGSWSGPASRFRVWQFVEPLRRLGHEVTVRVTFPGHYWRSPLTLRGVRYLYGKLGSYCRTLSALHCLRDANRYDVIFINRPVVPEANVTFIEPWLAKRNPRLIFDFDDAIQHVGNNEAKLRRILPHFAHVTAGNEYLAAFARPLHPRVDVWPTVINADSYQPVPVRPPGPVRIGWSGSRDTLAHCLPLLESVIRDVSQTESFEFVVIADVPPAAAWPGVALRYIPWTPQTEVAGLQQIDVGLMPLQDKPFERGKCGLKAIQYMGCGIPAVVSPVGVNEQIVVDGQTGFHCRSPGDWGDRLRILLRDPDLRRTMGAAARARVEANYSVQSLIPAMVRLFERVAGFTPSPGTKSQPPSHGGK